MEILHERENWEGGESHLKDNGEKFNNHCVAVLRLLYQGKRLNARQLETEYGYDGRRIRDVAANRKDVKKQWVKSSEGKTRYVEYWMEIPAIPTKSMCIQKAERVIEDLKQTERILVTVFSLPPDEPIVDKPAKKKKSIINQQPFI